MRKGRGRRKQGGTEGGGSTTIQKRKGRGHRNQEGTEGGGSATIQRAGEEDEEEKKELADKILEPLPEVREKCKSGAICWKVQFSCMGSYERLILVFE